MCLTPYLDGRLAEDLHSLGLPVVGFYFAPKLWLPGTRGYREQRRFEIPGCPHSRLEDLAVLAYSASCGVRHKSSAAVHMGSALSPAPPAWEPPPALRDFLAAGAPPVCLCFGSMDIYATEWSRQLLAALRHAVVERRAVRLLAMGSLVPEEVRAWPATLWVGAAPHAWLFPRCACVLHHAGSGTSVAAAVAGVPSVAMPVLDWLDQPYFSRWLEQNGAGIHLSRGQRSYAEIAAAVHRATADDGLRRGAQKLGELLRSEARPDEAVRVRRTRREEP